MASAIPSGCARDARQVGRRTWRPRFFCGPSHCAVHADCVVPLGARSRRLRPTAVIGEMDIPRCTGGLMPPRRDKATCASRMLHPAQRAHGCRPHPYFGTEESVLWNRRKSTTGKFQPTRGEAAFIKMSGTRRSGRALRCRRGAGDQGQPVPRRDRRGARSMAQRERLHDDSRRAHRAIASGPSAHVFSAHAFDKALSQRHGSGSRRPRRLVPPVRD